MILDKIKTVGIYLLMTFAVITTASTWILIKDNRELRAELTIKQVELDRCILNVQHAEKEKEVADKTLDDVFNEHEKLAEDFSELKDQLNKKRCGATKRVEHIYLKSKGETNEAATTDHSNDIRAVGVYLEQAACLANNDCDKPSESPSKPL